MGRRGRIRRGSAGNPLYQSEIAGPVATTAVRRGARENLKKKKKVECPATELGGTIVVSPNPFPGGVLERGRGTGFDLR